MNKRSVLAPVKKPVVEATPLEVQRRDLDDKEIFALPKNDTSAKKSKVKSNEEDQTAVDDAEDNIPEIQEPPISDTPDVKEKKAKRYAHLEKARQRSLEARRKKAEEKSRLQSDVDAYKEKLEFERLSKKFSALKAPEPAPAPVAQYEPPVEKQTAPVAKSMASVNPSHDMSSSMIDYDKLIGGVAERLQSQNSYYAQLESDIRADERKKAEATYNEQLKSWEGQQHRQHQREQAYSAISSHHKRNNVFDRSARLRDTYTQRYKNNWYTNY